MRRLIYAWLVVILPATGSAAWGDESWRLDGKTGEIVFRPSDAGIKYFGPKGKSESIFHSGTAGLWEAKLQDGRVLRASESRNLDCRRQGERGLRLDFRGEAIDVTVTATAAGDAFELVAEVSPRQGVLLSFGLPARLEFAPERLVRLVAPASGNESVGFGLRGGFFEKRTDKKAYYQYRATYPPAFADFFHWETAAGQAAVYRVQPRTWQPWQAAKDPQAIFTPGEISFGGSPTGGYRLEGWGWLWRIGGFWPSPKVILPVTVGVLEHLYTHAPEPSLPGGAGYLWHLAIRLP